MVDVSLIVPCSCTDNLDAVPMIAHQDECLYRKVVATMRRSHLSPSRLSGPLALTQGETRKVLGQLLEEIPEYVDSSSAVWGGARMVQIIREQVR